MKITKIETFQIETPRYYGITHPTILSSPLGIYAKPLPPVRSDGTGALYGITSEGTHPSGSQSSSSTKRTWTGCRIRFG